jgi:hypothetical protein
MPGLVPGTHAEVRLMLQEETDVIVPFLQP